MAGNDTLIGGDGDDLYGAGQSDTIDGGRGNDIIRGGDGLDTLKGGLGADDFIWKAGDEGMDTVKDFFIGEDWIGIQDFLQDSVPVGGSYVGKVFAMQTWDGSGDVILTAKADAGSKAPRNSLRCRKENL